MLARSKARVISILLSLVMVISAMPIQAFAAEPEAHDHDHTSEPIIAEELETAAPEEEADTDGEETPADNEDTTGAGDSTPAEGDGTDTEGDGAPAEGDGTDTEGDGAPAEGDGTDTEGDGAPAEEDGTDAEGGGAPAEGDGTDAEGGGAPAEGDGTDTEGDGAPAEGNGTDTEGDGAPAEGDGTDTEGDGAPVEGEVIPEGSVPEEELPEEILQEELVQEIEVSEAYQDIQDQIDDLLMAYLGSTELTRDEIEDIVVGEMDGGMILEAQWEIMCIEEDAMATLSEDEQQMLVDENEVVIDFADALSEHAEPIGLYKTVSALDGQLTINDSAGTVSVSGTTVTATAKGSLFSKKENTIDITNNSGSTAQLSFDYTASSANSFKIAGASAAASGSYTAMLAAGNSVTVVIQSKSGVSDLTATLTMSNISLTAAAASSNVTFEYDSTLGGITVDGAAVESGAVHTIDLGNTAALVATPNSGSSFLGWIDAEGKILSSDASFAVSTPTDMTVKAVFVGSGSAPYFYVGASVQKSVSSGFLRLSKLYYHEVGAAYLFDDLSEAATFAAGDSSNKVIVLANSGTLPAGNYTIPAGVTLLIPFDGVNRLFTTDVLNTGTYTTPTPYRTLTMADGANLTINGGMSISAMQKYAAGSKDDGGAPTGPVGFVQMQGDSSITVNNGGALYAYGFVTGSGSVTIKSGGKVYEMFQFSDFRGGTQSTDMQNGVFPLSQYYVQNVEVPMTLEFGATEYAYTTIYMSSADFGSSVAFIAKSNAMFNLTSGSVTKYYDGDTDRLMVSSTGDLKLASINMDVGGTAINSKNYELPINSNITVEIESGAITIEQDVAFLPGSEIVVGPTATCKLGNGYNIYLYDADEWGTYCGATNKKLIPVKYAPGKNYTRTEADLVDAVIEINGVVDASEGYVYTTVGGANVCSTGNGQVKIKEGTQSVTYQLIQGDGEGKGYIQVPITPAKLKNADGTYKETAGAEVPIFNYVDGVWVNECYHDGETKSTTEDGKAATCTTDGEKYTVTVCVKCGTEINRVPDVIPALGHDYKAVATAPTCTTGGYTTHTCSRCGDSYTDTEVSALGHTEETLAAVDPTCTETGLTEGKKCSVCGEILVAQNVVAANGHSHTGKVTTPPTCGATGIKTFTCSACGDTYTEVIPATGDHELDFDNSVIVKPTCEEDGYEIISCVYCDFKETYAGDPALGHDPVTVAGTPATCEATGLTAGKKCSACGEILAAQEEIPALGHNYDDGVVTTEPTCDQEGVKTYTCQNDTSHTYTEKVPTIAHTEEIIPAVAPGCESTGLTEGKKCSACGATLLAQETVDALGHAWNEGEVTVAPDCENAGVMTYICGTCGETKTEAIDKLGHKEEPVAGAPATCESTGLTEGTKCSVCGAMLTSQEVIPALGHDWDEGTVSTPATCTEPGMMSYTCRNDETHTKTEVIPATDHKWNEGVVTREPSCSEAGSKLYTCQNDASHTRVETIRSTGHQPEEVEIAPTCETGGTTSLVCSQCGQVILVIDETPALGHKYEGEVTQAATCTEAGLMTYTCQNDASHTYTEAIEAVGHKEETIPAVDATCTATGLTDGVKCSACGEILTAQKEIPARGHKEEIIPGKAADCVNTGLTDGVKCSVCGEILTAQKEIPALGHTEETIPGKDASCTATGLTDGVKCSVCGEILTAQKEIPARGHKEESIPGKAADCVNTGLTEGKKCSVCGETVVVQTEIPALGHTEETIPGKDATCTATGLTDGVKCSVCGEMLTAQEEIPVIDHNYNDGVVTAEPKCEEEGVKTFTCSVCGHTYTETVAATGHDYSAVVTPPTCTEDGYTTHTCANCGDTYQDSKMGALGHVNEQGDDNKCDICGNDMCEADGHTEEIVPGKEATCEESGLTDGVKCSACGEILTAQKEIPARGHKEEIIPGKAADCVNTGLTEGKKCSVCGETVVVQTEIPALGHTEETIPGKAATCTATGLTDGVKCSACGEILTARKEIPALGHKEEIIPGKAATCTATGLTDGVKCSACGETLAAQEEIPALGHKEEIIPGKAATCTATGLTDGVKCSVCGETLTAQKEIPTRGHKEEIIPGKAADCVNTGLTDGVRCSVCGEILTAQKEISALGHTEETIPGKDATCTATGLTDGVKCSACGEILTAQETVPALGHTWGEGTVTKAADCENDGIMAYTCGTCGETKTEVIKSVGHQYEETVVPPTCKDQGYTEHTCTVCGDSFKDNWTVGKHKYSQGIWNDPTCTKGGYYSYVCTVCGTGYDIPDPNEPPLGHTEETIAGKEATCTEAGLTAGVKCSVCGETLTAQEEIPALGHTEETIPAVDASCEETGLTAGVKCSVCGETLTAQEEIPALGHTEETIPAVDATCEETGLTAGVKCSVCGETLTAQEEIPALGHKYVGVETEAADCENTGVMTYTCSVCGDSYTEEIAAIGHDWGKGVVTKAATCTEEGEETFTCQNDESHTKVEIIGVIPHKDDGGDYRCDVCGQSMCVEHQYESVVTQPTCQQGGYTTYTCANCGNTYTGNETAKADHLYTKYTSDNNATCTKNGTQSAFCDYGCGTKKTRPLEGSVLPHDYIEIKVQATCETEGYTLRTCSRCGDERKYVTAQPKGHAYDNGVVTTAPGCETTGVMTYTCKNDPAHTKTEVLDALGHEPAEVVRESVQMGNCTTGSSYDNVVYCSACGEELSRETVVIAAKDHVESEAVVENKTEPDCDDAGSYDNVVYCSACGDELSRETVTVDALGHKAGEIVVESEVAPDCENAGSYDNVVYCTVCEEELSRETVTVDALGHKWNSGVITLEATCVDEGVKRFTCMTCRDTKEEPVKPLDHDLVEHEAQKPTYTDIGWNAYVTCTRCDYTTYEELPALGEATITTFEEFVENLTILEELTDLYVKKVSPGKDPAGLIIKYIRTGVDRYNSGSWNIMAGYEDADFAKFITDYENDYNANLSEGQELLAVTGLKNIDPFYLPNGDFADIGHVFGTMDITYTNKSSVNHADVAGWGGDLVDLLSLSDQFGVEATELEDLVAEVTRKYFLRFEEEFPEKPNEGTFSLTDVYGDLDGFHIMQELYATEYENGVLTELFSGYLTEELTAKDRAEYFLANRLGGVSLRGDVRDAVYNTYLGNSVIATLEGTREFKTEKLNDLRKAVCYAFADYICKLGGDYVQSTDNPYLTVFQSTTSTLAPGITQKINYATTADDQTMVYYIATGDITRDDVHVYANYNNNDPGAGWAMQRVLDQANAAQAKYGDPASEQYIENYNVIVSTNGDGYNMHTGEPGGLLVMDGYEWHPCDGSGFFAILADGTARIGTLADYKELKAQGLVKEAIGAFGTTLVSEGKINVTASGNYFTDRASRTAVGITATGKVVMLVIDGRQGEFSCGASAIEIAQIMLDAGCYTAVNLDGGGSSTYVARPEGEDALRVVSSPSDGAARSVSTSLLMVSTAPSSTAFDHAVLNSDYAYLTAGASTQLSAKGVSATGNVVELPEGTTWAVSDETLGAIDGSGVFTASANGQVDVNLMLGEEIIGSKTLYVVTPDNVYFDKDNINAIYGHDVELPVKAVYEGKNVAITESDVALSLGNPSAGTIDGFVFTGIEESGLKKVTVKAALAADASVTASMLITLYSEDEASFDFDNATGGDRQLAWDREVSNSAQQSADVYRVVDPAEPMTTTYTFAIDMSKIDIPDKLADLTYMLPGADMENASAWNFLLQLAERVSVLTEVRPSLTFDPNFEVDYSEMTVANEYFLLGEDGVEFDEESNTLTLILNWKDQSEPIDADTANPLCILSGIKLTPREGAQWDAKSQLKAVNTGEISYEIYLRANALYSFAQKPENQEIYGLKPFDNPDVIIGGATEKGASFGDIYKRFEDSYTLVNAVKDGWVIEEGGFAYYKDGERLTGICEVDGLYYDFGDDGINAGQTPYTGAMVDEEGDEYYLVNGAKYCGWWTVDQKDIRYYNEETGVREILSADETPSTCIIDGHCIYTTESGLVKRIDYDDAGGHDYVEQADGSYVCALCGYVRIEMPDVNVTLSYYECTYTGAARTPSTTAAAKDGRVLTKPGQSDYPDYSSTYKNNVEVGTASVTLKAARYGKYSNLQTWRGNAAGEITVTYEIRPDVPVNVEMTANGDVAVMTWDAAKAPGVTYVIYRTADGSEWEEFATTEETTCSVDLADCDGCMFRIGTRKIVDGKAYESLTFTKNVSAGIVVMADNNEEGKPILKWSAVSGAESYQVYRATRQNGTYSKVFTTGGNSYTHSSATEGTTYYYKVKAVLADGTEVTSEIVTAICKAPEMEIEITTGNNAEGKPTLKWTAVDGAASYQVYRATKENGTYSKVFSTAGTTYTHASAQVGSTYYYKLKVILESGTEVFTDVVTNTCLAPEKEIVIELETGNNADGKPTLKWNAIEGAEAYAVYRSTTEGGTYAKVFSAVGTTYTHVSAIAGKSYFYKLKVTMDDGTEVYSDVVTNTCMIPEAKFIITTGNNADGKPTLKWQAIAGASSYEVHRSTTENGTYQKVFATTGTSYTHVSATAGRSYYYKLKVILNDGSEEFSQIVTNTCLIPGAMFSITTGNNGDGKPTLKWAAIAGAESYEVYRSVEEAGLYQRVFTTAGTTYTHVSAAPGNTYYYKLKVILVDGTEKTSDIIVNSCLNLNYDFVITTGNNAAGKPTMAWEPIVDAESYEVYRSNTKNGAYNQVFTTAGTTYTHVSAVEGNTYYYKLKVIFSDGSAKTSDIVTNSCLGA